MKNKYLILSIILILIFSLTGCSLKQNYSEEDITQKVNSEIDYLDTQLLGMLNKLNNISFQKYLVIPDKVTEDSTSTSSENDEQSSSQESNSSGEGESSGSDQSSESDSSSTGESSSSASETSIKYSMQPNNILNRTDVVQWENFNTDIENLYNAWSTITIDLYKKEVDNNLVLNFSSDLQTALNSIKAQDKNSTLINLAKIYSYVPRFSSIVNGENLKTSVLKTKASLINAYSVVEQDNWQKVQSDLVTTEQNYMPVLNSIISNPNKEYNINKAYILIKETRKKC